MASGLGTAVIDFGATPATEATVEVAGQDDITADARVEAWVMARSTSDNNTIDHQYAAISFRLSTSEPVPGNGFSITAYNLFGYATGRGCSAPARQHFRMGFASGKYNAAPQSRGRAPDCLARFVKDLRHAYRLS